MDPIQALEELIEEMKMDDPGNTDVPTQWQCAGCLGLHSGVPALIIPSVEVMATARYCAPCTENVHIKGRDQPVQVDMGQIGVPVPKLNEWPETYPCQDEDCPDICRVMEAEKGKNVAQYTCPNGHDSKVLASRLNDKWHFEALPF